jgi:ethanolamine utilization microcompartment shell protein EutL
MPADLLSARLLATELALKSLAQLLHEQRVVKLDTLADTIEARAGLLAMLAGGPTPADVRDALNEIVADLRETAAELGGDDG